MSIKSNNKIERNIINMEVFCI